MHVGGQGRQTHSQHSLCRCEGVSVAVIFCDSNIFFYSYHNGTTTTNKDMLASKSI